MLHSIKNLFPKSSSLAYLLYLYQFLILIIR